MMRGPIEKSGGHLSCVIRPVGWSELAVLKRYELTSA